jgi:hypothetical protein
MPTIDKALEADGTPIPERFVAASLLYVEYFITGSTFGSKDELIDSDAFRECVLPIFNDWYHEKYRDLAKKKVKKYYLGVAFVYSLPIELRIPSTTSVVVEEGKLSKLMFPDHMQESENITDIIQSNINFETMDSKTASDLKAQIENIVAFSRSINIDVNTASNLKKPANDMAMGIWEHFEKGVIDILSGKSESLAVACWEFHLAIEKSLKVLCHSKFATTKRSHSFDDFIVPLNDHGCQLDTSELLKLPSDKEAIKLRYAELVRRPAEVYNYYLIALKFVSEVCSQLEHQYGFKNSSFTLKIAPWAR